jgi:hypothetical protein
MDRWTERWLFVRTANGRLADILGKCKTEIDRIFTSAPEESKAKLVASLFIYSQQRLQE